MGQQINLTFKNNALEAELYKWIKNHNNQGVFIKSILLEYFRMEKQGEIKAWNPYQMRHTIQYANTYNNQVPLQERTNLNLHTFNSQILNTDTTEEETYKVDLGEWEAD